MAAHPLPRFGDATSLQAAIPAGIRQSGASLPPCDERTHLASATEPVPACQRGQWSSRPVQAVISPAALQAEAPGLAVDPSGPATAVLGRQGTPGTWAGLHHRLYALATMSLWRAWFRGLQHWERVRRPPTPAEEDAAYEDRIRAGQAKQERAGSRRRLIRVAGQPPKLSRSQAGSYHPLSSLPRRLWRLANEKARYVARIRPGT